MDVAQADWEPDLQMLLRRLRKAWGDRLDAVVLFGSRARGDARPDSDWDFLVIVQGLPERDPMARSRQWRRIVGAPWCFWANPILLTPQEWYGRPWHLALDIALDGVVLLDAHGRMRDYLTRLRKALQKTGWRRVQKGREIYWEADHPLAPGRWVEEIWEEAQA